MADDGYSRRQGDSSTIAFDETEMEEAINAVRVIGLTLMALGLNAHPGDTVPAESVLWVGGHLSDAGGRLSDQFRALHARRT